MAENVMLETTVSMDIHPMIRDSKVAKGELKSLNKSLKAQQKAFKETGYDAEGLAEKERLLTKATEAQQTVLDDTKKAYDRATEAVKDKNNMTAKEANAISRTRGAYSAAQYEMRKYNTEIEKVKANQVQLANSTKELTQQSKELETNNKRVVAYYKTMGNEVGALKAQYNGLQKEINQNNIVLNKEKETLQQLKSVVSETSIVYKQQEAAVESARKKYSSLVTEQNRVSTSLGKMSVDTDKVSVSTGRMSRSLGLVASGFRGLMAAGARTSAMINRMGNSFRNVGLVIGGMGMGTLIQNFSTLVPLASSLVSVLAGVGGMAASLSGAAIGLGGAFGIATIAAKLFSGQAKTALQMVEDGTMGASSALTLYKNSLTGLQDQWKGLVQANSGAIFTTMANGINIARFALTTLNPFITKTANQISKFSTRMKNWVTDSQNAGAAFGMLNKIGPRVFQNILNSIFKVTDGLANMAVQFAPLFTYMAGGLEKMANSFNNWANSVSTNNGIAAFIEYTKKSLPLTGQIFGNVFSGIISLFQAFSGHSLTVMEGMAGVTNTFREWAANLSGTEGFKNFIKYLNENGPKAWELLKNIGTIIVGVIKGLAPVGSFMLDVAVAITGFVGSLVKANPVLGAFLGILSAVIGGIMAFAPPIMLLWQVLAPVVTFIGGLVVPAFTALGTAIAGITAPVWGAIAIIAGLIAALAWLNTKIKPIDWGPIFSKLGSSLSNAWNGMLAWFRGAWTRFTTWLPTLGASLSGAWSFIWSGLTTVVRNAMNGVLSIVRWVFTTSLGVFTMLGGVLKTAWGLIWGGIKNLAVWYMTGLTNSLRIIWGGIVTFAKFIFGGLKTFFVWIWSSISAVVMPIVRGIGSGIRLVFSGVSTFLKWIWGGISAYFRWSWGIIKGIFSWGAQAINVVVRIVFAAIGQFIRWIFNGILSFVKWVWAGIKNSIVFYANLIKTLVTAAWNILSRVTRAIFNGVKTFLIWVWTVIKNRVVGLARGLWNIVRGIWNVLSRVSRSIFNSLRNFFVMIWTAIKNRVVGQARALWSIVRSIWNVLSRVSRSIFSNVRNFIVAVWTNLRNRVVAFSRSLWNIVRGIWNTLSKVSRSIFSNVRNFIVSVWTNLRNRVVAFTRSLWNIVRGIWNTLSRVTRNIFNSVRNFLVGIWTKIRDRVTGIARSLWSKVSGTWNSLSSGTKRVFNAVRNYLVDKWEGIKSKVTGIASSLWSSVKDTFTNMKNGIKGLAGKIGDTITGMVKGIKKGLNSLIKGVNWVAKKLGVDEKIPELSTGTGGVSHAPTGIGAGVSNGAVSSGGFATVNDSGRGNGSGSGGHQELIQKANGQVFAPKGKDVTVPLGKGDRVINGKDTQRLQQSGAIPKFAKGLGSGFATEKMLKDIKKKKKKKDDEEHGAMDAIGTRFGVAGGGESWQEKLAGGLGTAAGKLEGGRKKVVAGAKAGAKVAKDKIGDLLDYVGNPGKLFDAVLGKFGVKFPKINGQIPKDMMWDPMWKQLKNATRTLFDGWLTEADGAGDGGYIDLSKGINFGYAPSAAKAAAMGYPFPRAHHGIDVNYKYGEKLYSTMSGTATGKSGYNGGFGNSMWIKNGPLEAIYGHMSKLNWTGSKKVKPGSYLGKVGSTGDSTGPHLHYEMRRNGQHFNPIPWLKENDGGGTKKSASKWKGEIKRAAKATDVKLSNKELKGIIAQIQRESNGDAGVTQGNIGDINNLRGTPAQGLLQYVPSTFKSYATKGHKNIKNGYHQLLAFFNNSNWRRDLPYGRSGWGPTGRNRGYAKGTESARAGLANVFEKGGEIMNLRGGEQIIPNDVSINAMKSMMSSDLFNRTQAAVYAGISRYAEALERKQEQKRIKDLQAQQQANANSTDIKELKSMMADMVYLMQQQLGVQENIAGSNEAIAGKSNVMDLEKTTKKVSEQEAFNALMRNYNSGVTNIR